MVCLKRNRIVFITGEYMPRPQAVGGCVRSFAQSLKDDFDVTVICVGGPDSERCGADEGYRIIAVNTDFGRKRSAIETAYRSNTGDEVVRARRFAIRAYGYARRVLSPTIKNQALVRAILRTLNELEARPDVLIPSCSPFEGVYAAALYCNENEGTLCAPFLSDLYGGAVGLYRSKLQGRIKQRFNLRDERFVFKASSSVMQVTWGDYIDANLSEFSSKVIKTEHPFPYLCRQAGAGAAEAPSGDVKTMVFTGSLSAWVSPDAALGLYERLQGGLPELVFYTAGDCARKVEAFGKRDGRVSVHGWVTPEELVRVINDADYCLSIAERRGLQMSSKILQYMVQCKPILHIYYASDDVNLKYLERYPLALCIRANSIEDATTQGLIKDWLSSVGSVQLAREDVLAAFPELDARTIMMDLFKRLGLPISGREARRKRVD